MTLADPADEQASFENKSGGALPVATPATVSWAFKDQEERLPGRTMSSRYNVYLHALIIKKCTECRRPRLQ